MTFEFVNQMLTFTTFQPNIIQETQKLQILILFTVLLEKPMCYIFVLH